jgi:uncharacterized membrane protein YfcA
VILGTLLGARLLIRLTEGIFRRLIAVLLLGLGGYMLLGPGSPR